MSQAIEIESSFYSPKSIEQTAAFLVSPSAAITFRGHRLIPSIEKVVTEGQDRVITSRRGKERRERVLVASEEKIWLEIYPRFPEKLFCRSLHERLDLQSKREKTEVKRRMTISYRPGMRPAARILANQLGKAIEKNNQALVDRLDYMQEPETWA